MAFADLFYAVLALLGAGAVAGTLAGLLGVGGGLVLVPVLYYLGGAFGVDDAVRMHMALGTSLATIIMTSAFSARAHFKRGSIDVRALKALAPGVVLGVAGGAALAGVLKGPALTGFFAVFAMIAAFRMALSKPPSAVTDHLPGWPTLLGAGGLIGGISVLVGIGGGTISVPVLTLFGRPIHRAVGTSAAIGAVIAVPGALGFVLTGWGYAPLPPYSLGYVSLPAALVIVCATMLFAPLGARLAHATDPARLKKVFALILAVAASRMLYEVLIG